MLTDITIALSAALVFGAATTAVAVVNYKTYASLAALDPHSELAVVYAHNWATGHDTSRSWQAFKRSDQLAQVK